MHGKTQHRIERSASASIPVSFTTPAGPGGAQAPSVTAIVNSASYAGGALAPGAIQGLYQINATVPSNSPTGSVPLQVIVGGTAAQSAVTMLFNSLATKLNAANRQKTRE